MLLGREEVESEFKFNLFVSSFENILLNLFPLFLIFFFLIFLQQWTGPDGYPIPDPIIFGNTQSVPDFFSESSGISGIGYFTFFGQMCL